LLQQMAHVDMVNVPYKSNPQAITDLIGGRFTFMFADAPTAAPGAGRQAARAGGQQQPAPGHPARGAHGGRGRVKGYDMGYWFAAYAGRHAQAHR
jgi:hypothetical protein